MWNWLKHLFRRPTEKRVAFISREPFTVTLSEWRADSVLVNSAQKILADQTIRIMIQVLHNSSPAWEVMPIGSIEERAIKQAQIEGYTMALANLTALAEFEKMEGLPEPTFEPEDMPLPQTNT